MTLNLTVPETRKLQPRITVFGVGGAGGNAVSNMIDSGLEGVDFVVANTDAQALLQSAAERRIQIGASVTEGLGAGSRPEVGREAAEEAQAEILEHLTGSHMVFITAGMGGGTGTGAAPVIARIAREQGILTVGVVTKPFQFEGSKRMILAEQGIEELQKYADTLIIIPNQNLFRVADEKTTFSDAFAMADAVLHSGVSGITDLMIKPGLINLDFADVRSVMDEMGRAMMGTGEASGENRAIDAAEAAITNPILDDISMKGAHGVLVNIIGGMDMTLYEVDQAANRIREEVDPDANIIVGSTFDGSLDGSMRISVVATGIDHARQGRIRPVQPSAIRLVQGHAGADVSDAPFLSVPSMTDTPPPAASAGEAVMEGSVGGYEAEVIIRRGTASMTATAAAVAAQPLTDPHLEGIPAYTEKKDPPPSLMPAARPTRTGNSLFERLAQARRMRAEASMPRTAVSVADDTTKPVIDPLPPAAEASMEALSPVEPTPPVEPMPPMPPMEPVEPIPPMEPMEPEAPEPMEPEEPVEPEAATESVPPMESIQEHPEEVFTDPMTDYMDQMEPPAETVPETVPEMAPETSDAFSEEDHEVISPTLPPALPPMPEDFEEEPPMTALMASPPDPLADSLPDMAPAPVEAEAEPEAPIEATAPVEAAADPVNPLPEMEEDQLEIPAFLRRQEGHQD